MNRALELGELFERLLLHGTTNTDVGSLWAYEFGTQGTDPDLLRALAAIQEKFACLRADIEKSEVSPKAKGLFQNAAGVLDQFTRIPGIFQSTQGKLAAQQNQIDILFMAAEALPEYLIPEINPLTIEALQEEIEKLISSIGETEFEPSFRSMLLAALNTLLLSVRSYHSLGPDGAAKMYGAAAAELARLYRSEGNTSDRKVLKKAISTCKKVGAAVIFAGAVVGGAHTAIEDGRDLLGIESSDSSTPK